MLKYKTVLTIIVILLSKICFGQGTNSIYTYKNWSSFKELENHLSDSTGYIGRMYEYIDKEMYFKDSNNRIQMFTDATIHYPSENGAIGDNVTDDTVAFKGLINCLSAGDIVRLQGKTYYLNTSEGITFPDKVKIEGPGKFRIGTGVGNNPGITISGDRSYLTRFEIEGDHTNFTNTSLATELRRGIKITGDYVVCDFLKDTNSIVGIELYTADYCTINRCNFRNTMIQAGDGANNYNAGVRLYASSHNKITDNSFYGYGNSILQSAGSYYNIYNGNSLRRSDNNGFYLSSGQWCSVVGNSVTECDGSGIRTRDSFHLISSNVVDTNSWAGGITGINVTGNGTGDADGFNGEHTIVIGNVIRGLFTNGVGFRVQDDYYFRNPLVVGNSIYLQDDPNEANYGIHIDGRSRGAILSDNTITNADYGIYIGVDDPNVDTHTDCVIANNHITESETYAIIADYLSKSSIHDNIFYDNGRYVISLTSAEGITISSNIFEGWYHVTASNFAIDIDGDNHIIKDNYFKRIAVGGGSYGIRLNDSTSYNLISGNTFKCLDYGILYTIPDPNTDSHTHNKICDNAFIDSNNGGMYCPGLQACVISNNTFSDVGDTQLEILDSNYVTVDKNYFYESGATGHVILDEAIIIRGNDYEVTNNYIRTNDSTSINGIVAYGDGTEDPNVYNGTNGVIKGNHIIGPWTNGIIVQADENDNYFKNPQIIGNTIEITTGGAYGIRLDGKSKEARIIGNYIMGHTIGIYLTIDTAGNTHERMIIKDNHVCGGSNDNLNLGYVTYSLITDNLAMNSLSSNTGIALDYCTHNQVINNMCGDSQATATQRYGIEELNTSDNNIIIDNYCEGLASSGLNRYTITGSSTLVETNRVVIETLSDNRTFEIGEARTFFMDPGGANRTFDPRNVTWPIINELIVINTADAAETITFDSGGLAAAIPQNNRGIFAYDGSNWFKVYIGS